MSINSEGLTIALSRRLAISEGRNQQAAIVQTAARLLADADGETKDSLMRLIAATPAQRQEIINLTERMFLAC